MNSNNLSLPKDQIDAIRYNIQQKKYDKALELLSFKDILNFIKKNK